MANTAAQEVARLDAIINAMVRQRISKLSVLEQIDIELSTRRG